MDQYSRDSLQSVSAEDFASQRSSARDSLLLAAPLRIGARASVQVRVRNLSAGGLMAEHSEPVATGTAVEIEVRGVGAVPGRVAWWAEGRMGIAFDVAIDPKAARKPVGKGAHTPLYAKSVVFRA